MSVKAWLGDGRMDHKSFSCIFSVVALGRQKSTFIIRLHPPNSVEKECIMPTSLPVAWLSAVVVAQHEGSHACQVEMWTHTQPAGKELRIWLGGERDFPLLTEFASRTEKRIKV